MRYLLLTIILFLSNSLAGQEKSIRKIDEQEFSKLKNEKTESNLKFLDYHQYGNDDAKYLMVDERRIDLLEEEYLVKATDETILTKAYNSEANSYRPIIYRRDGNTRTKIIDLPTEGTVLATEAGFLFIDFNHGQGCNYKFYSNDGILLNTYKPYKCFDFSIERVYDDFVLIGTQIDSDLKEMTISLLNHSGKLLNSKKISFKKTGISNLYFENNLIYVIQDDGNSNDLMKIFNKDFDLINQFDLGFVVRHDIFFQENSIAYISRGKVVVRDYQTGSLIWDRDLNSNSLTVGNSRDGKAVAVIIGDEDKQIVEFDITNGNELSRSGIPIKNTLLKRVITIANTKVGCIIYDGSNIVELKAKQQ